MGSILVIRGGAIGDFILTLPVFRALKEQFPAVALEVIGYSHIAELARLGGLVEVVRSIEARPLAGFFARNGDLDASLQSYFSRFDIVFSYLYDPDSIFRDNVARSTKAQFIQGPHRPDESKPIHATKVFLEPLTRLAIFDADSVPRLDIKAATVSGEWIALHPGSGSPKKNWPLEKWSALLKQLITESSAQILLVGGEADSDRMDHLAALLPPSRGAILQNAPLPEVAQRLSACKLFAGHDSGISHLAAALGVPTIVLWGESNEQIWRPAGPHVTVLRSSSGLSGLQVETVLHAIVTHAAR